MSKYRLEKLERPRDELGVAVDLPLGTAKLDGLRDSVVKGELMVGPVIGRPVVLHAKAKRSDLGFDIREITTSKVQKVTGDDFWTESGSHYRLTRLVGSLDGSEDQTRGPVAGRETDA